jgi:hypothetical protein
MLPTTCVVVPTYWTRADGATQPDDAIYDHPTSVAGPSTLPALLESLQRLESPPFFVLILVAVTGDDVASEAEAGVEGLIADYPGIPALTFGPSKLKWLHNWLAGRGMGYERSFLDLRGYARVRNLQLAIPHAMRSEVIVALDDDEVVVDPAFIEKAVEPLGSDIDSETVQGLSGYYLQKDNGILLHVDPAKAASSNVFDRKAAIMNSATEQLERLPGNIVETPFCFGGNMEFSSGLAASVGFDPGITRGEDIDYLINARMEGQKIFMRKDLRILHCPPEGGSYRDTSLIKLRQDIVRFIYEREKMAASQIVPDLKPVTPAELMPYPGDFLGEDLEAAATEALRNAGDDAPHELVTRSKAVARANMSRYLDFRVRWPAIMQTLHDAPEVRDQLLGGVRNA